jgi:hypothetical protein
VGKTALKVAAAAALTAAVGCGIAFLARMASR